ncbi:hypothetical protein JCM10599A_26230 [Paraburkholderia kururiensis]
MKDCQLQDNDMPTTWQRRDKLRNQLRTNYGNYGRTAIALRERRPGAASGSFARVTPRRIIAEPWARCANGRAWWSAMCGGGRPQAARKVKAAAKVRKGAC